MNPPEYLQIEPVGHCNLRCRMCPIELRQDKPPAFMRWEQFIELLDSLPDLEELHLQGLGEPLLHPRFCDMVREAVGRGIRVSTNTNMTLLTPKRADAVVASGLHRLCGSLDAANPEVYESIRVQSHFDTVLRNLEYLMGVRGSLDVSLVTVLMRRTLPELMGIVELAARLGVASVFVQHLCHDYGESTLPEAYLPMRDFVERETLLHADVEPVFAAVRARAQELGVQVRLPRVQPRAHAPETPGRKRCDWPWRGMYFSYDGQSMPCCMVSTPDRANFGRGNAAEIWEGEAYEDFRRKLSSEQPPEVCQSCSIYRGTF